MQSELKSPTTCSHLNGTFSSVPPFVNNPLIMHARNTAPAHKMKAQAEHNLPLQPPTHTHINTHT